MTRVQEIVEPDGSVVRRKPAVGDMRWDGNVWRRWSGRRWATAAYSLHPDRLRVATPFDERSIIDKASRHRAVALAVEDQVATNRATVVFDGPSGVVLAYRRRVSHVFHALMTVHGRALGGRVARRDARQERGPGAAGGRSLGQRLGQAGRRSIDD